jgi:ATP-dependent helicase/nuclease subunit A
MTVPEIRDLLNLLRALADPLDDLAMAGLLRSPAFALTDAALYQLRYAGGEKTSYWLALQGDLSMLAGGDRERAQRALDILTRLLPQVDRTPVAELLKHLVDETDYRAILATAGGGSGGRLWRNLDKLLADAQASGQINVRDFLDYLATLSDAGAREGEAPAEAQGAVRLMTIHKSKGLQFPIVVLADAGRKDVNRGDQVSLLPETGLAIKLSPPPLLYHLASELDKDQDKSEAARVLYVALTRAEEKLIISGHATGEKFRADGWMQAILGLVPVDLAELAGNPGIAQEVLTPGGFVVRCLVGAGEVSAGAQEQAQFTAETAANSPLYRPLVQARPVSETHDEPEEERTWRATGTGAQVPPGVVGQLVHKAIERWVFPDDPRLVPLLERTILGLGISSEDQRVAAVKRSLELLGRLRVHPLWEEIDQASVRYHEVPYLRQPGDYTETGYIDLLFKSTEGWQVVDFKTDVIRDEQGLQKLVETYRRQMQRYAGAVQGLLGEPAGVKICFLDDRGRVRVVGL